MSMFRRMSYLLAVGLCVSLASTSTATAEGGPTFGSVALGGGNQPATFNTIISSSGTLREHQWNGSSWVTSFVTPNGQGMTSLIGGTTHSASGSNMPVVFGMGNPGSGSTAIVWDDGLTKLGFESWNPVPGVSVDIAIGATSTSTSAYAFVRDMSGNVQSLTLSNSVWTWTNHGKPPGTTVQAAIGALSSYNGTWNPYAFVRGADGNLWSRWWTGSAWQWTNHGTPSGGFSSSLGTTVVSNSKPSVYVKGNDGNLWSREYNSSWSWQNHGKPSTTSIAMSLGATCGVNCTRPILFVTGGDGNVWTAEWNGSAWVWTNHSKPSGVTIQRSLGTCAVNNTLPNLFVVGSDSRVWHLYWSGSSWIWENIAPL